MSVAAPAAAQPTAEVSLLIDVGSAWTKASVVGRARGRWRIAASVAQPTAWGEEALEEALAARLAIGADQRLRGRLSEMVEAAPRIACGTPRRIGRLAIAAVGDADRAAAVRRAADAAGWMVAASSSTEDGRPLSERLAALSATDVDVWLLTAPDELVPTEQVLEEAALVAAARRDRGGAVVWAGAPAMTEPLSALFEEGALSAIAPATPEGDGQDAGPLSADLERLLEQLVAGHDRRRASPAGFQRAVAELARQERLRIGGIDLGAHYATWVLADGTGEAPTRVGGVLAAGGLGSPAFGSPQVAGRLARQMSSRIDDLAVADALQNLRSRPGSIPNGEDELAVAMAAGRMQLASIAATPGWGSVDVLIGAGRLIAAAPSPARAMQLILDGIRPVGVTQVALDSAGVLPPLGSVAGDEIAEAIGFLRDDLLVPLGTAIVSRGGRPGHIAFRATVHRAGWPSMGPVEVRVGQVSVLPLARGERADVELQTDESVNLGAARRGRRLHAQVSGGSVGLVLDARDAPVQLPRRTDDRRSVQQAWQDALLAEPAPQRSVKEQ
jgi:hypothetical protein